MAFYRVIIAFIILHSKQLFALPVANSLEESSTYLFHSVPSVANVSTINQDKACIPPILIENFIDMGCKSKITYDDFQENRIPQLIPQIKCVSNIPTLIYRSKHIGVACEEVKYNMSVIYAIETDNAHDMGYRSSFDSISVACIRSKHPSLVMERISSHLILESIE